MTDTSSLERLTFRTNNRIDVRRVELTSPMLHIGSKDGQINRFEYVNIGDYIYYPDTDALARDLLKLGEDKLNTYIGLIERGESIKNLLKTTFGNDWETTLKPILGTPIKRTTNRNISGLRPFIRNGFGYRYIPGSSIKGAIRTAIIYALISRPQEFNTPQNQQLSAIEKELNRSLNNLSQSKRNAKSGDNKNTKNVDNDLFMDTLFTDFSLTARGHSYDEIQMGANTDFMRAVHITDSDPLEVLERRNDKQDKILTPYNDPLLVEVATTSYLGKSQNKQIKDRGSTLAEVVRNVKTCVNISVDTEMLGWFKHRQDMTIPFSCVDDLLILCQEFAQKQWEVECKYWTEMKNDTRGKIVLDLYKPRKDPYQIRFGWGSGMTGTTINSLLSEETAMQIRDVLMPKKAPGYPAPKSRRIVLDAQCHPTHVLGWTKLTPAPLC